jgi:hypothetical protein
MLCGVVHVTGSKFYLIVTELDFERFLTIQIKIFDATCIFLTQFEQTFLHFIPKKIIFQILFCMRQKKLVKCDVVSCFGAFGKVVRLKTDPFLSCMLAQSW